MRTSRVRIGDRGAAPTPGLTVAARWYMLRPLAAPTITDR
jgi:hypothetical protein